MFMTMPQRQVQPEISLKKKVHPHKSDGQTGNDSQPWIQVLRNNMFLNIKRNGSKQENSGGVAGGYEHAENPRMKSCAVRSHEISSDERFAVAGLKCVKCTQ